MNAAKLNTSDRLQRFHNLLKTGGEYSTLEVTTHARICAVNSAASELRANGIPVACRRDGDKWFYRLEVGR